MVYGPVRPVKKFYRSGPVGKRPVEIICSTGEIPAETGEIPAKTGEISAKTGKKVTNFSEDNF